MEHITNNIELNAHFIQGSLWQEKKKKFENKIAIPYFLYIDDAEVNNPLGSHCTPISFIYYAFPVIDNCEIFAAAIFKGKDYKEFGNKIATKEGNKTVYFVLRLVIGDNLGINTILGFVSSFSAYYFCRFFKTIKTSTHKECILNMNLIRNSENYEEDLLLSDVSLTGIKENSILNSIQSFHVTSNFSVDVMHDIFEGVCHYDMCHIIQKLLDMRYFDLNKLNDRKMLFNYGEIEVGNVSPQITQNNLNKFHLKMSAREMMSFVSLFPIMVGDLVSNDHEVWLFFLNLLDIIEILLSFNIPRDQVERLKYLIKRHHQDYVYLFNDTLKPKHHIMLHYYNVIMQSGPLRNF